MTRKAAMPRKKPMNFFCIYNNNKIFTEVPKRLYLVADYSYSLGW
jgi:hypothetical protein